GSMSGACDCVDAGGHLRVRRPVAEEVLVLDVEVYPVEAVRGREPDEVLDELRTVRVVAGGRPVVVARAADRDDRLDAWVCMDGRDPGRHVDVVDVAGV